MIQCIYKKIDELQDRYVEADWRRDTDQAQFIRREIEFLQSRVDKGELYYVGF